MAGDVVRRVEGLPLDRGAFALSPDSAKLYFAGGGGATPPQIVALNTQSLRVAWRDTSLSNGVRQVVLDGINLYGVSSMAVSPDGARLFVAAAYRGLASMDSTPGIAVLDAETRARTALIDHLVVEPDGMATLRPGLYAPNGAILVIGQRDPIGSTRDDSLFAIDPLTLEMLDSAAIGTPVASGSSLVAVVPSKDGHDVYVVGATALYKFDLTSHAVLASAPRPATGVLVLAPAESALYMTDAGDSFDNPGSGLIFVFSPDLVPRPALTLPPAETGQRRRTTGAAVSQDGTELYVMSGSALHGPLYSPQAGQLLVIDLVHNSARSTISLNEWSPERVYVR